MCRRLLEGPGRMTAKQSVLIDADVGIDDAIAMIYLAGRSDTEIVAVGTVHGNCPSENATQNALYVLEVCGRLDLTVAAGAPTPLDQSVQYAAHVHGSDGLGDQGFAPKTMRRSDESAAEQILRISRERPNEVHLLALGPLTNLALAVQADPDVLTRYRSVVIMGGGGAFPVPGVLRAPDMNTSYDKLAAEIVYSAPRQEMVMVGANVCSPTVLDEEAVEQIAASDTPQAEFVSQILPTYTYAYARRYGRNVCPMYDALAAAVLVDPTYATNHRIGPVNVIDDGYVARAWLMEREDDGPLALDVSPTPPTRTVMAVDGCRFIEQLVEAITTPLPATKHEPHLPHVNP